MAFIQPSLQTKSSSPLFRKLRASHKASQRLFTIKQTALAKLEKTGPIDFEELQQHTRQYDYQRRYLDYKRKHRFKQLHLDHQQQAQSMLPSPKKIPNQRLEFIKRSKEFSVQVRKRLSLISSSPKLPESKGEKRRAFQVSSRSAKAFDRKAAQFEVRLKHSQGLQAMEFSRRASEAYISSIRSKLLALRALA